MTDIRYMPDKILNQPFQHQDTFQHQDINPDDDYTYEKYVSLYNWIKLYYILNNEICTRYEKTLLERMIKKISLIEKILKLKI